MSAFFTDLLHILQNPYIALIFFTALVFDFINGFHDAANSIATLVGTRVLRPFQAVCWAQHLPGTDIYALLAAHHGALWSGTFAGLVTWSGARLARSEEHTSELQSLR